ncbi:hypothetical protein [Agriterribacter sp.]|uniref:hypothetical protein n=1 Tax=Agriterribacter sp. TaxID=2821509 RepID=UPI002B8B2EEF|nr:hypothetical protein [Agriterribacter sp.]HRO45150.1 hypothetical protein [Agriterribacter sp.]HRQ17755.1 hypothetical protein [Agriterribacter sp.]
MNNTLQPEDVKARIALLEAQTRVMEDGLRERIRATYNSLTPVNLLKSAFNEVTADSGLKSSILNIALKLGLGYMGGRLFWNPTGSIAKKAVGAALQLGTSREVSKKLSIWKKFIANLFTKDKKAA